MKRLLMLILIFIISLSITNTYAQNEKTSILINANLSFPTGQYGETLGEYPHVTRRFGFDYGNEIGLASMGYGVGVELTTPAFIDHLGWIISAQLILNPTDDEQINSYFQKNTSSNISLESGTWFHVPILTGFSYGFNLTRDFNLYVSVQGGLNITKEASFKATADNVLVEEATFDTNIDFGFETGITLEFMNKYNLGIKYLNLGYPRYKGNRYLNDDYFQDAYLNNNPIYGDERSVHLFLINLGYRI